MTILAALALITALPWLYPWITGRELGDLAIMCCVAGAGCALAIALLSLPTIRMEVHADLAQHREVGRTIEHARKNGREIESAAMQVAIAERNADLVNLQYWNRTVFDLWIPDAVDKYEPIR